MSGLEIVDSLPHVSFRGEDERGQAVIIVLDLEHFQVGIDMRMID